MQKQLIRFLSIKFKTYHDKLKYIHIASNHDKLKYIHTASRVSITELLMLVLGFEMKNTG